MKARSSPLAKTPPSNLPFIAGVTRSELSDNKEFVCLNTRPKSSSNEGAKLDAKPKMNGAKDKYSGRNDLSLADHEYLN